jgi:hypothetical protein
LALSETGSSSQRQTVHVHLFISISTLRRIKANIREGMLLQQRSMHLNVRLKHGWERLLQVNPQVTAAMDAAGIGWYLVPPLDLDLRPEWSVILIH